MYTNVYKCMYMYINIHIKTVILHVVDATKRRICECVCVCVCVFIYLCMYVCICIYIYIYYIKVIQHVVDATKRRKHANKVMLVSKEA